jgi:hypothetical protein
MVTRGKGRPSKFTPAVREALINAITAGLTYTHACSIVGIEYNTFNEWRKKGAKLDERDADGYYDFHEALTRAESNASTAMMATVRKVAQGYSIKRPFTDRAGRLITDKDGKPVLFDDPILPDWRAAAWWLERRYPEEYGRQRVEVTGKDGGAIIIKTGMSLDDL